MADYHNMVAMITGAASGIGYAIAAAYHRAGARVALIDIRNDALNQAMGLLDHASDRVMAIAADVRDARDVAHIMDQTQKTFGRPNILVNAAGLYPSDPVLSMSEAAWDRVLDTNLKGPFLMSQAFARRLVRAKTPGSIINITSGAAYRARPGASHYATSKAGLVMLTQALALELAPYDIRVNAVSPGFIEVNSGANPVSDEYAQAIQKTIPLGRPGSPEDIAAAALFLTSDASRWTTGTVLRVDGGSGTGTMALPLSRRTEE